jgi:hypothetical protein
VSRTGTAGFFPFGALRVRMTSVAAAVLAVTPSSFAAR